MNKKSVFSIATIVAVLFIALVVVLRSFLLTPYNGMIKQADELVQQQKYEKAIQVYKEAIRLDAKKTEAYLKLANLMNEMNIKDLVSDIHTMLSEAYIENQSKAIEKIYIKIADEFEKSGQTDMAIDLLTKGYTTLYSSDVLKRKEELANGIRDKIVNDIYDAYINNDITQIRSLISTTSFKTVLKYAQGKPINKVNNGNGIAIYGDGFVYGGTFSGEKREGEGTLYYEEDAISYTYTGNWAGDKPNGRGTITYQAKVGTINNNLSTSVIEADFVNGKVNGAIYQKDTTTGGIVFTYNYSAQNGVIDINPMFDSSGDTYIAAVSNEDKSRTITAKKGMTFGVAGF